MYYYYPPFTERKGTPEIRSLSQGHIVYKQQNWYVNPRSAILTSEPVSAPKVLAPCPQSSLNPTARLSKSDVSLSSLVM